ncbi:MAG: YiiD C-terminal domain-containing protein [Nevskia sp.]|nr:YiiD C-terminal domain-containing protein [Nevskia sp.]
MSPEAYTEYLHRHIPLTAAMQLRVLHSGGDGIELVAPLAPNRNHRDTAFGGSLATLGIVSGWALLQQGLRQEGLDARIVVQKSECEFLEPADAEFSAESRLPAQDWPRFLATLRKRGRARITVHSVLRCAGHDVVQHSGTFVALAGEAR